MCEHGEDGAFGLVLNRRLEVTLGEALSPLAGEAAGRLPLHRGGPVQPETLFFLHDRAALGGAEVLPGVYLGGDEEGLERLVAACREDDAPRCRVFSGYSGWGGGQLEFEMSQQAWVTADAGPDLVFEEDEAALWSRVLRGLGGRWAIMGQTPPDPDLN